MYVLEKIALLLAIEGALHEDGVAAHRIVVLAAAALDNLMPAAAYSRRAGVFASSTWSVAHCARPSRHEVVARAQPAADAAAEEVRATVQLATASASDERRRTA